MNRREFSRNSIIGLISIVLPGIPAIGHELPDFLPDREAAAAVGVAYLREHPELASRSALLRQLDLPEELTNLQRIAAHIERHINKDFESQRVLVLDGWLVAKSEAALCGLVVLS